MIDKEIEKLCLSALTLGPEVALARLGMGRVHRDAYAAIEFLILPSDLPRGEYRRIARLPAVVALTRQARVVAARAAGNPHRGLIPGGEDERAYLRAVQTQDDPDPVWR